MSPAPSLLAAALLLTLVLPAIAENDPDSGSALLGKPAPEWRFDRWVRGPAREVEDLRGHVVLLRWWTEGCRFCRTTLPALERLQREHPGLVVIGVFHPKPPRAVSDRHVLGVARKLGFTGPIALDARWRALDRYWLDGHPERNWTSVSFLLDPAGVIRWVHGGGEYHPSGDPAHARCEQDYRELEQAVRRLMADRSAAGS